MKQILFLIAVLLVGVVNAETMVIYQDDFSGDGSSLLNGGAPDVDNYGSGGNLWSSNYGFYTDGDIGGSDGSAILPFVPQAGFVYELSADLTAITGIENWLGIGFQRDALDSAGASDGADRMSNAYGYSWVFYRDPLESSTRYNGQVVLCPGPNTTGYQYLGHLIDDVTVPHTFKVVLDTTGATWTTQAFLDGTAISAQLDMSSTTNINYVGITASLSGIVGATIDNFIFTVTDNSTPTIHTEADYTDLIYDIYIDATTENLWPTDAASYPTLEDWTVSDITTYNKWYTKTGSTAAINGTSFEGFGVDLSQLTMAIDGLDNTKVYDVYAVCWVKKQAGNEYWYTYAGLEGNSLRLGDYYTAENAFSDGEFLIQGVQVYLGQVSGVTSCNVDIDGPVTNSATSRAWFDGVALVDATIDSVRSAPAPGQHDYTEDEVVELNAYDYIDCPNYNVFSRWIGDVVDPYSPQTTVIMDSDKTVIAVFTDMNDEIVCGDVCHPILLGDVNKDCMIDILDLSILAEDWAVSEN